MSADSFEIKACALIVQMDGQPSAINLRELLDRAAHCSDESIYHHFCENQLRPTFDDPEFTNDFATWAYRALRDDMLAERLAMLDPYTYDSIGELRAYLLDILEERLSQIDHIPWAGYGQAFYFMKASMLILDTQIRLVHPEEMLWVLRRMTNSSIYYHFMESKQRLRKNNNHLCDWLRAQNDLGMRLANVFDAVDGQFYSLGALRQEFLFRARHIVGTEEP